MAANPEETKAVTTEGAGLLNEPTLEKQPESSPAVESTDKKEDAKAVDNATAGVADLSVSEKKEEEKEVEKVETEEKKEEPKEEPKTEVKEEEPKEEKKEESKGESKTEEAPPATTTTTTTTSTTTPAVAAPSDAQPEASTVEPTTGPVWPETAPDHPLTKFYDAFEALVTEAQHSEVYGIELSKSNTFHTKLILQKFLRANQNDLNKAKAQLLETLKWRKSFDPVKAATETFDKARFEGLGYVLEVEGVPESPNKKDITTFNVYGAVKDNKATFGDLDGFLRWRVGLMEKSVQALSLSSATAPIPNYGEGPDPYQGFQVHDYLQVSFIRRDPLVKAATNKTIEILGRHYPETLSRKFFVNVPAIMGWVFTAVKLVVAKETSRKFVVLSDGKQLATQLGKGVPKSYGGEKPELAECAETMAMA
ncbi:hypothetical protein GGP41_009792 [Bipolaris sorokiniana]|uniref:Phosphatidylinositol transfer protein SFH5 n=2 Tax=Cochliobolus sativus TaxID=45130 RepID=A0A8H5ZI95_COCSA|nr:uncharacterized protein COCSADRAFT_163267 [Bipolaris sorokiniana ND90Pr]EMD60839.1 hypothetical protein COCSADRAFT_163267 [Bipolaris sorokiniana ND90Pr]KAF5848704.1 hypothetical protein GGP41_009792 [Bipolaris sorokiniana]